MRAKLRFAPTTGRMGVRVNAIHEPDQAPNGHRQMLGLARSPRQGHEKENLARILLDQVTVVLWPRGFRLI